MTTASSAGSDGAVPDRAVSPAPETAVPQRPGVSRRRAALFAALVLVVGFALDQWSKAWAVAALGDGQQIPLVPTVRFALVYNPGVSFGMGAGIGPLLTVGIMVLALGLTVWVGWQIRHRVQLVQVLLLSAVLAGALGNLVDRITRAEGGPLTGHVVDFIAVQWFAVFNVADILTVCGMILWAITMVFGHRDAAPDAPAEPA